MLTQAGMERRTLYRPGSSGLDKSIIVAIADTMSRVSGLERDAIKKSFDIKNQTIESLSQEVNDLREKVTALTSALAELVAKYDRVNSRVTTVLSDFSQLQSDITTAFEDVQRVQAAESDSLNSMLTGLHKVFDLRAQTLGSIGSDDLLGTVLNSVSKGPVSQALGVVSSVQTAVSEMESEITRTSDKVEEAVGSIGAVMNAGANILERLMSPRQHH